MSCFEPSCAAPLAPDPSKPIRARRSWIWGTLSFFGLESTTSATSTYFFWPSDSFSIFFGLALLSLFAEVLYSLRQVLNDLAVPSCLFGGLAFTLLEGESTLDYLNARTIFKPSTWFSFCNGFLFFSDVGVTAILPLLLDLWPLFLLWLALRALCPDGPPLLLWTSAQ